MRKYLKKVLTDLPSEFNGTAVTPANEHLFKINELCTKLDREKADLFHHVVKQLLFLSKRERPDILTSIAFLTTRVKSPDEDDYKKLQRCIAYLRNTANLTLTLEADGSGTINWWVDAAFAVHDDMKSRIGMIMSFRKGAVYAALFK